MSEAPRILGPLENLDSRVSKLESKAVETETATPRKPAGVILPCPYCGECTASISVVLDDMSFRCNECDTDFTWEDIVAIIEKWTDLLARLSSAFPAEEES